MPFWLQTGSSLIFWIQAEQGLIPIWFQIGPGWMPFWLQTGLSLMAFWLQTEASLMPFWLSGTRINALLAPCKTRLNVFWFKAMYKCLLYTDKTFDLTQFIFWFYLSIVGQFNNKSGLAACDECNEGQFQNVTGQTDCLACAEGQYCGYVDIIT